MRDITLITIRGRSPVIHPDAFVAPGCRIIGDVEIGAHASIWYNCVLRGDVNAIRIGERSNIQDGTIIHCDADKGPIPGTPTIIGDDCLIGHSCMLHGCTVESGGFVGLGSIVMDGCVIESEAMLAAGAMLTPGKRIPAGQLWGGRPARYMRDLDDAFRAMNRAGVAHYVTNAAAHKVAISAD